MNKIFDKLINSIKQYNLTKVRLILLILKMMVSLTTAAVLSRIVNSNKDSLFVFIGIVLYFALDAILNNKVVDPIIELHCDNKQ